MLAERRVHNCQGAAIKLLGKPCWVAKWGCAKHRRGLKDLPGAAPARGCRMCWGGRADPSSHAPRAGSECGRRSEGIAEDLVCT